jgi:tetratricopeptide (TPR) repeat protein
LYETALMQYEQGEAMRLEHPYVQHNMGLVLGRLGGEANLTRAVSCFKAHIDMNPSEDAGYLGLANCYCDLHQYDLAISTLHAALRVLPDCEDAHFNLGSTLRHRAQTQRGDPSAQRSDFEASVAAYQAALRLSPEHSESSHNLGLAFLGLGMLLCDSDKLASRRALGDALLADHDHHERHGESDVRFDCALRLGNVHSELGHYTQAEAWYREAIRLNPQQSEAYWNLGRLLDLHLGRPNAALDSFRTHHALHPNCAEATYSVAHALARARPRGDEAEMIALLRRAIELDPSFSSPYPKIGALYCDIDVVEGGDLLMTFLDLAS